MNMDEMYRQDNNHDRHKRKVAPTTAAKRNPATLPPVVRSSGTIYRFVMTICAEEMRDLVENLGKQPNRQEMDAGNRNGERLYHEIAKFYNNELNSALSSIPMSDINMQDMLELNNIDEDVCGTDYDKLNATDCLNLKKHIDHHYRVAHEKNKMSGNHGDFHNFVGQRPFLYLYHLLMKESSSYTVLHRAAVKGIPADVFRDGGFQKTPSKPPPRSTRSSLSSSGKRKSRPENDLGHSMRMLVDLKRAEMEKNSNDYSSKLRKVEDDLDKNLEKRTANMTKTLKLQEQLNQCSDEHTKERMKDLLCDLERADIMLGKSYRVVEKKRDDILEDARSPVSSPIKRLELCFETSDVSDDEEV
ncbi:unnamed protein product [Cylindrotheca closterium]|nr:unnamed protein product [Cylindrotheca closterium]